MKIYTEKEQKENLERACNALEKNKKKAVLQMRDDKGGRCCLCVMAEEAEKITGEDCGSNNFHAPHAKLADIYGIENAMIDEFNFVLEINGKKAFASEFNDGNISSKIRRTSHKSIAKSIREQFINKKE